MYEVICPGSSDKDCPAYSGELEICCPHCGEVLATYSEDYAYNNPNGFDMWQDQLLSQHELYCEANPLGENTPDKVLFEGELHFKNNTKKFQIIEHYYWFNNGFSTYEEASIIVKWDKGGSSTGETTLIVKEWSEAVLGELKNIPEELRWDFVQAAASALRYEIEMKNPHLKVEIDTPMWGFEVRVIKNTNLHSRSKKDVEEIIIEEA
ncbi:hypothetical protein [Caminibacter sp.]